MTLELILQDIELSENTINDNTFDVWYDKSAKTFLAVEVVEKVVEKVVETKVVDANAVVLTDTDKAEIDDLLRRAIQFVEKAQYTEPPEKSAKAALDQIKQIDPKGQYRGNEVKSLLSKIVDHYLDLAEKSAALSDSANAGKWLDRAKLMNTDREVIIEKEKALGLVVNSER